MNRYTIIIAALCPLILSAMQTHAKSDDNAVVNNKANAPTIKITKLDVNDTTLKLTWEIRNDSSQDVWILAGFGKTGVSAEAFMDKDDRTLLIRARLDFPLIYTSLHNLYGRYVLLRAGQTRAESVTLAIPVYPAYPFGSGRRALGLEYATRVAIEIGYYAGNLPEMIRGILEKVDKVDIKRSHDDEEIKLHFRGSLHFNEVNEILRQRDEEILIPHTNQHLKGEQVLRKIVEDLHIPYEEKFVVYTRPETLDIPPCTRVEIQYQPSMLEYYFSYAGQQSLLSRAEKQELRSLKTIIIADQQRTKAFVNDINKVILTAAIVREINTAHVVCYHEDKSLTSFHIYNNDSIVSDERDRYIHPKGFPDLRKVTPQIEPFELRVRCAANLKDLWHRFRLYHKAEKERLKESYSNSDILYPTPANWCDAMVLAYQTTGMLDTFIMRPHICPSAGGGKCHYAMNPHCKPNSPADTVLLFETKAGWNQHGGPELFTCDNHNPKGGCVLLNDGTVKFIRTNEELQQLRWK